jgi:hypothetical protein
MTKSLQLAAIGSGRYNLMASTAATPKDQLRRVVEDQPDDSSFEEIIKELAFAAMVERGLADAKAGRTVSHETSPRGAGSPVLRPYPV